MALPSARAGWWGVCRWGIVNLSDPATVSTFASRGFRLLCGRMQPCCVDTKGGRSSPAVAEAAGDGAEVDTGRQELGGVVPQCVDVGFDTETFGHVLVAAGDGVRRVGLAGIEVVHSENTYMSSVNSMPRSAIRRWQWALCSRSNTIVSVSSAIRRIWCVFVSFSLPTPRQTFLEVTVATRDGRAGGSRTHDLTEE